MANQPRLKVGYGLSEQLPSIFPSPIVAKRVPTVNDTGYQIGQIWVVPSVPSAYILVNIAAGIATWSLIEASGAAGIFSSLTVTPGPTSITGTTGINTSGAGVTTINTGGTGALNLGNATGNTSVTGSLATTTSLSAGTTVTAGTGITATTGNIVATAGAVTAGTTVTASLGNITATNGNLQLGTTGNKILIVTGANGSIGTSAAMTAGTVTVATTAVTASSIIFLTANTPGGTQGVLSAPTASIVAGTSFVINSSNNADTSTVNYWIIN